MCIDIEKKNRISLFVTRHSIKIIICFLAKECVKDIKIKKMKKKKKYTSCANK